MVSTCAACQSAKTTPASATAPAAEGYGRGMASWYTDTKTASGERYCRKSLTAAHRSLPMGTRVLVRNVSNGRTVVVRINDRGPYIKGRTIDVSEAAARELGMINSGIAKVELLPEAKAAN